LSLSKWGFARELFAPGCKLNPAEPVDCPDRYEAMSAFLEEVNSYRGDHPVPAIYLYAFGQEMPRPDPFDGGVNQLPWSLTYYDDAGGLGLFGEARILRDYPF
jgi:hypothetical protein